MSKDNGGVFFLERVVVMEGVVEDTKFKLAIVVEKEIVMWGVGDYMYADKGRKVG